MAVNSNVQVQCGVVIVALIGYGTALVSGLEAQAPNLVAAYGFNEGSGTTLSDLSGNGNNGTIANGTWTASGKFGAALVFNGSSTKVTVSDAATLHLSTAMTLEAWVNASAVTSAWRDVIYKGVDNFYLEGTSDKNKVPAAGGTFGTNDTAAFATAALGLNTWMHLTETYDGSTIRLYVNGVQVSSLAQTGAIATSTKPLQIGGDSDWGQYFKGMIDEIRIYNGALTATQIQTDMNTPVAPAGPDTQPPSAPANLAAAAVSQTQISLNWTASTDNIGVIGYLVERCQGPGCTGFAQIATPVGTSYNDAGLTANTTYTYRVRATDAAGNSSGYSNLSTTATPTPDAQPPTAPSNLGATAVSGSQINLSWTASTDNVGVTNYLIERCQSVNCNNFTQVATSAGTTYNDTGLASNTNYSYRARAADAAGNLSSYSNTVTATTQATPSGLVAAYSFSEGAGTTVGDASGNGNIGTTANATWTTSGKYGSALMFNGTNARVNINDATVLHLATALTLEAWVNPSAVTNAWRDVIYKGNDNFYLEATSQNNQVPAAGGTFGGNDTGAYGTAALPLNTWTHLAETYDGSAIRLYVNGVEVSSLAQTGNVAASTKQLQIGGDSDWGQYFKGAIDEIRVYNVALTAAQIQADMNTPVGSSTSYPAATLSTASVNFGNQTVGVPSSAQTVTVTNSGAASLLISNVTVTGTNASEFAQTNNCSALIEVNASCTISVVFTPVAAGTRTASLSISDNALNSPQTASLTGSGITGLSITPRVTVLTPTGVQQFTASGSGVTWSVDGVAGGNSSVGSITAAGLYTPPTAAGTHTVTATSGGSLSGNATVYISTYPGTFTYHNDNFRTGQNVNETVLTPLNVTQTQFGKLNTYALDGIAYASPLYVANVNIAGQGFHNVVYVATEHDSVYAFDADGLSSSPLWKVSFVNAAAGVTTVPAADTGETGDIPNEIGITGTPVIDSATSTLYVVAKTKEVSGGTTNYVQRLHALDIKSGAEKFGGPVVIQASVPGTGDGSQGTTVPFVSLRENQRPGLLLSNGVVYIGFASHGDQHPWHGWVLGYNATTLQQVMAYNVTPNDYGGGIWQGGCALAADSAGNIYFVTGNGAFDANTGGSDYGDSFVKLAPNGTVVDYFAPHDQASMDANNLDLGSGGSALLLDQSGPNAHLMVSAGKGGTVYVVNRDNMGHYNPSNDNQIVQALPNIFQGGTPEPGNFSSPVYFNGYIYFSAISNPLQAFQMINGRLLTSAVSQTPESYNYPGGTMAISANQSTNGVLWVVQRTGASSAGVLRAYDATNLAMELYNSGQAGSRDTLDVAAKYSIPLIANGKVFVGSNSKLTIYGLLP